MTLFVILSSKKEKNFIDRNKKNGTPKKRCTVLKFIKMN